MSTVHIENNIDGYWYVVEFTEDEAKTLAWLANRYETAAILWAHVDDFNTLGLPEHQAWRYLEWLVEENGNPNQILPTCAGGTLASKLIDLWEVIV